MKRITFYSFKSIIYLLLFIGNYANAQSSSLIWSKTLGQGIGADHLNDITTDSLGNIYATGSFNPSMDFDPGPGTTFITSAGYHDMYIAKYDNTGNLIWVKTMGGASSDYWAAIELDHLGNIYTIGTFRFSVDFDPGPNSTTYSHDYYGDLAIAKYTNNGDFIWAKHLKCNGSVDNWAYDLALDDSLNVFVTGHFRTTVDFDPSPSNTVNLTSSGVNDIFLAKYDSSGNYKWAFNIGSSNEDYGYDLTIDDSNNVYLAGYFSGTVDFDPGPNTASFSSNGGTDAIVAKYDRNGNYQWGKNIGDVGNDELRGITIGQDNHLYLSGRFTGTTNFDPGSVGFNLSSVGNTDIFIAKYTLNGNFLWAKGIGGSGEDKSEGIVADLHGNFYHYGRFSSTADFNPGASGHILSAANSSLDNYVAKFNNNGDFVNAFSLPSTTSNQYIAGLTILNNQNILLGGSFNGSINLSPNSQTTNINTTGHHDIFMSTYTPLSSFNLTATPISQTQIDLQWSDVSSSEVGYTIERSDSANGPFVQVGFTNANDTTFSDLTGLTTGNTYYYRVAWVDSSGTTSAYSLVVDTVTHPNVPIAPANLTTSPLSASKIQLNWTDNSSNETGFIVQRAAVNGSFSGIDSVSTNVTTYVDSNLTAATTYVYRILAYNSGGASNPSNTSSATTFNLAPTPPDNLTATGVSDMQINLNWSDNSTDETFFILQRSTSVSGPYTVLDTLPQNTTNYSDYLGLSMGTTYYYLLSAGNISGTSVSDSVYSQTKNTPLAQSFNSSLKCEDDKFCHEWELMQDVDNAIGFDFTITYDTAHFQFAGLQYDELDSNLWDYSSYTNPDLSVNISVYVKPSAPSGTDFSGDGPLACLTFYKNHQYLAGIDSITFSPLTISYNDGIEKRGINKSAIKVTKDSLASGKLLSWNNLQPMLYNVSNSSAFNKTEIFGANTTCDTISTIASTPNMSGVFYHNINNGEQLKIKRDIDSTTIVMPFINGYDAFLTKRIVLGDTSYQPTIKTIIAADVNRDGVVTAGDITLLNQRTTMKINQFPYTIPGTTDDWLFTDSASTQEASYQISANFPNDDGTGYSRHRVPAFESCLPIDVTYLGACPNFEQMTYYGLLLGDVDGNFQQFGANGNFKTEEATVIYDLNEAIKLGNSQIKIPVYISGDNATQSVDFQMDYNKNALEFVNVASSVSSLDYLSNEFNQSLLFTSYSAQSIDENDVVGYLLFNTKTQEITPTDLGTIDSYVNGNKVSSKVTGAISTSINRLNTSPEENIRVFPNPNNGLFSVQLIPSKTIHLKVFSMDGKLIWSKDIKDLQESYLQEVSLVDYASGIYTLSIETEEQRVIKRIVIQ